MGAWYQFSASQTGFVGELLELLRKENKQTKWQQRRTFGVNKKDFMRLQGMPLPRPMQFTQDARRIAASCNVSNSDQFVKWLVVARGLKKSAQLRNDSLPQPGSLLQSAYYQAAMDVDETLDEYPEDKE